MLANKDAPGVLRLLTPGVDRVVAVPVGHHDHHHPKSLVAIATSFGVAATTSGTLSQALDLVGAAGPVEVLIAGSLYLAGEALALNDELPT